MVAALAALIVAAVVAPTSSRLVNSLATPPAFVDPGTAAASAGDPTSPVVAKRRRPDAIGPVSSMAIPFGVSRPEVLQPRPTPREPSIAPDVEATAEVAPAPAPTFVAPAPAAPPAPQPTPAPAPTRTKPGKGPKSTAKTDDPVYDLTIAGAAVAKNDNKNAEKNEIGGGKADNESESKPDRKPKEGQK